MSAPAPSRDRLREALARALAEALDPGAAGWLASARDEVAKEPARRLPVLFPQLLRRLGAAPVVGADHPARRVEAPGLVADLAAWRRADAGAAQLVDASRAAGLGAGELRELYDHGDADERIQLMRYLPLLDDDTLALELLGEAQRSNHQELFEAAWCEHDSAARRLDEAGFNRMVLKLAFADIPLQRVPGALSRANPELSRMLCEFAQEREAAGRPVWPSTMPLLGAAPCPGAHARLLGGLEHGHDPLRLAAVQGLGRLREPDPTPALRARLPREQHPAIRRAIERALDHREASPEA